MKNQCPECESTRIVKGYCTNCSEDLREDRKVIIASAKQIVKWVIGFTVVIIIFRLLQGGDTLFY